MFINQHVNLEEKLLLLFFQDKIKLSLKGLNNAFVVNVAFTIMMMMMIIMWESTIIFYNYKVTQTNQ